MSVVSTVLREYGSAIRGDWSDIDGRSVRNALDTIADQVDILTMSLDDLRDCVGICIAGGGHWCGSWYGYCNKIDCGCPCTKDA